jgi:hypothetical protein
MVDHDDETDDTADYSGAPVLVDPVAAAIALTDLVDQWTKLYKLAINKTNKARLRALAKLEQRIADAEAKLAAIEADAAAIVAKAESAVKVIHDEVQRRLEAVATTEDELVEREQKIARLEAVWRNIGEPADVMSGFRSPEYSPLQKARISHGQQPGKDPAQFLFSEPGAAPAMRIDALSDTCDDPHADRQGAPFLGELTRDVSHHKRRGAA